MGKSQTPKPPTLSLEQWRQVENEVVFRRANEKIQNDLDKLKKMAKSDGHDPKLPGEDTPLHFCCECSDENCQERIVMKIGKYRELHQDRKRFIVIPSHESASIEKVVSKTSQYRVVDKLLTPLESASKLNSTSVNNV